jgi:hypothetical protein
LKKTHTAIESVPDLDIAMLQKESETRKCTVYTYAMERVEIVLLFTKDMKSPKKVMLDMEKNIVVII